MSELLRVENLRAGYGKVEILHDVSLELEAGTLCAIVGANGAGKTTLLLAISSVIPKRGGSVHFDGLDISRVAPHDIVRRGLAHVPEGRRMLQAMSVDENLLIAAALTPQSERAKTVAALYERFPILETRRGVPAGSLSGGEQQMLAIARAMASKPRLLLLDEPSMGLAPKLVSEIFAIVAELRAAGTTILLVEQNARRALAMADRAYVLERGRVVLGGTGAELATNRAVTTAYLGADPT